MPNLQPDRRAFDISEFPVLFVYHPHDAIKNIYNWLLNLQVYSFAFTVKKVMKKYQRRQVRAGLQPRSSLFFILHLPSFRLSKLIVSANSMRSILQKYTNERFTVMWKSIHDSCIKEICSENCWQKWLNSGKVCRIYSRDWLGKLLLFIVFLTTIYMFLVELLRVMQSCIVKAADWNGWVIFRVISFNSFTYMM